jgi:ABC-type multidrug transport system ATPase subunit
MGRRGGSCAIRQAARSNVVRKEMMNAVETENLTRTFNGLHAVDGLTFTVGEGEVFGLLGPNGAGKTTTIRMLTGQLRPTAGRARVVGCDVVSEQERLKPQIGVVFEYQNLYERMSGRENLAFSTRGCSSPAPCSIAPRSFSWMSQPRDWTQP